MITLSKLREVVENGLNAISTQEFKIFADAGEFTKSFRNYNSNDITRYINGILEAMSPTILPMKNLQVITQSFRVNFILDMDLLNKDESGEFIEVKSIRALLEKYISAQNGVSFYLPDDETRNFEITPTFSGVTVGIATQISPIGNALPMYLDFSCVFVESGVNTNNVNFIINGENMFFSEYSVTRTRPAETNMVANVKSTQTLVQANGISLMLKMPLLNTDESQNIEEDIWGGSQNEAVCVEKYRIGENGQQTSYHAYIMIYGDNSETGQIGQNIGQTINLVEGKRKQLTYNTTTNKGWGTKTQVVTQQQAGTEILIDYSSVLPIGSTANTWIAFWSDGIVDKATTIERPSHTFNRAGTYTAKVYWYNDPNIIEEETEEVEQEQTE